MSAARRLRQAGFTIVEIAIVVVIISLLMAVIIKGESLITSAKVQDAITLSQDVSVALRDFKQRYHMYPGDLNINAATPEILGVRAACIGTGTNAGDNSGVISVTESKCIPEVLLKTGVGAATLDADGWYIFTTRYGPARIMAAALSSVSIAYPPSVINVVRFEQLPCKVAQEIDRKIDDGDFSTGKARASVAACTAGDPATDPVPFFAIGL